MNAKKLQEKLEAKKQEIIQGVVCPKCNAPIVYILRGRGHAGSELRYIECEPETVLVYSQSGESYFGYPPHDCQK